MSSWVLDASALLAVLQDEPGKERVLQALDEGALVSTVNLAEAVTKLAFVGTPEAAVRAAVGRLDVEVAGFDEDDALATGLLRPATRAFGLSLGDRACITLARRAGLPALTTDRAWRDVGPLLDVEVEVFR